MAPGLSLLVVVQYLLSFLTQYSYAVVLVDVLPPQRGSLFRRDEYSSLDLQDEEVYLWGGKNITLQRNKQKEEFADQL